MKQIVITHPWPKALRSECCWLACFLYSIHLRTSYLGKTSRRLVLPISVNLIHTHTGTPTAQANIHIPLRLFPGDSWPCQVELTITGSDTVQRASGQQMNYPVETDRGAWVSGTEAGRPRQLSRAESEAGSTNQNTGSILKNASSRGPGCSAFASVVLFCHESAQFLSKGRNRCYLTNRRGGSPPT